MHYKVIRSNNESNVSLIPYSSLGYHKDNDFQYCIPCWSLSALLKLMPILLEGYWRWILTGHSSGYSCTYLNGDKAFHSENGSTDIEAAYNMVVWLKENNYV